MFSLFPKLDQLAPVELYPNLEQPDLRDPPDPRIDLYTRALMTLRNRDQRWESNLRRFSKWDQRTQLKWIAYIEKNAQADPPLPMARELLLMAFTLRMTT